MRKYEKYILSYKAAVIEDVQGKYTIIMKVIFIHIDNKLQSADYYMP